MINKSYELYKFLATNGNNLELQELDDRLTQTLISPSPETDNWIELEY